MSQTPALASPTCGFEAPRIMRGEPLMAWPLRDKRRRITIVVAAPDRIWRMVRRQPFQYRDFQLVRSSGTRMLLQ